MTNPTEPLFHSQITDSLSDNHQKAFISIYCDNCEEMLHAGNNECMQPWFEYESGNFCVSCFLIKFDDLL
jgi:hypothetical protein